MILIIGHHHTLETTRYYAVAPSVDILYNRIYVNYKCNCPPMLKKGEKNPKLLNEVVSLN